jgi:hypothetical protein
MAIADLLQSPQEALDWAHFSFANAAHHHDIIRIIGRDQSKFLDEFVLDPIDKDGFTNWLFLHATMHRQMTAALGIQGYDLQQLDLKDPEDLAHWIGLHADEHIRVGQILNLE